MTYTKIIVKSKRMTLSELRKELKMSQSALAEALDVSKRTIENWEYGSSKLTLDVAQIQILSHLLKKIGKSFDDLETEPMNRNRKPLDYAVSS